MATLIVGPAFALSQWSVVVLHTFSGSDGAHPNTPLVAVSPGDFLGTTWSGGSWDWGTIFRISRTGTFASLYSFRGAGDGASPQRLVVGPDGAVYGTTAERSAGQSTIRGTFFRIGPSGVPTTLYVFSVVTDGYRPSNLMVANDGFFYGATAAGGINGLGTAFRLNTQGQLTVLHAFGATSSGYTDQLYGPMVQGPDGNLYATSFSGVARMTLSGDVSPMLYSGGWPSQFLLTGRDGRIYGSAVNGFPCDRSNVFSFSPAGDFRFGPIVQSLGDCGDFMLSFQNADHAILGSWIVTSSGGTSSVVRVTPQGDVPNPNKYPGSGAVMWLTDGGDGLMYGVKYGLLSPDVGSIVSMPVDGVPLPPGNVRIKSRGPR